MMSKKDLTPKEIAQRRTAARKHGRYASSPARQILPACNRRQCPLDAFPCPIRRAADEMGRVMEVCPLPLVTDDHTQEAFLRALRDQDPTSLSHVTAMSLAAQQQLYEGEMTKLQEEGFVLDEEYETKEGDLIMRSVLNPRAWPTMKLAEIQGHTAHQQAITPKASGERKRDEGIGGMFAALKGMREKFGDADEPKALAEGE